uniref:Uncharacterized protein n=1 Tax=Periophthalmus magnuspinnatus TaxID=409849 RepID=A0A3B4B7E7_9GOBI
MMERSGSIQVDIPDFSNSVLTHLNQLRVQGRLCDIVVHVQGQSFRAHKVVLAASSPYFRDHMSLSQMSTVSLTVIRNPCVFEQLLSFCYTGRLCLQLADIISYLTAASFLQMQHIIDRCTQILEGIHLKISLADLEEEQREEGPRSARARSLESVVRSGHSLRLLGPRAEEAETPPEEPPSPPPPVEHSGAKEPVLRINRAGQWYVETSSEPERSAMDRVHIKTERLEEWMGAESQQEEGGAMEEGTVMIDSSGRSTVVTATAVGAIATRSNIQPSSSFSETERFSPTGSVVVLADRQRAKSESPNRADELRQPSSQVPNTSFDMGGYEDYLREQVGDRWYRYNPRLTCIYCCKSFNQKGSLDRHMRLHMGITPFVCRICGKKYTRKDQLEYHIRKHTGNKPFHCHVCGKSFPFQAILNQHFRKNHPGCAPQEAQSASPETTMVTSRGGPSDEASPSQDEPEGGNGNGGGGGYGEGPQASVSTTGPD